MFENGRLVGVNKFDELVSFGKRVPDFAYAAPEEFTKGLLRGYFDGDGNVQCDDLHHCLRGCSRSEKLIKDLGLLYAYKGICVNYFKRFCD